MKNILPIFLTTLSVALATSRVSYDGYKVYRVFVADRENAADVVSSLSDTLSLDMWKNSKEHLDVRAAPSTQDEVEKVFSESELNYRIMVGNVQALIDETATKTKSMERYSGRAHSMDWETYHSLQEIYDYIDYIAGNLINFIQTGCV